MSKYPKKPTAVTFMVNYTYEKNRLNGNIPDATTWYNEQKANIKKVCDKFDMAAITRFHDADFKRTPDHSDFLRDLNGQLIPEDDHYHAILVGLSGKQARLKAWAKLLEENGIHISKVNEEHQTLSNLQGLSTKRETFESALAYLVHATPRARKDNKHQYKTVDFINCERLFGVSTPKEVAAMLDKIVEHQKEIPIEFDKEDYSVFYRQQREEVDKGIDLQELQTEYKKRFGVQYADYEKTYLLDLQKARVRYLQELSKQLTFFDRKFSYIQIYGHGGVGKSRLASNLASHLAGKSLHIHTAGAPGKRKTPDLVSTYTDELVSVAHEIKPTTFSTSTFESFMEPDRYPVINSRNQDKPYFAVNFINAKSTPPDEWAYEMFYWDLLSQDKASVNFNYRCGGDGRGLEYKPFPKVYDDLLTADADFFEKRWNKFGQQRFLDEWWQVVRRITFLIHLSIEEENGMLIAKIYKLDAGTMPDALMYVGLLDRKGEQFKKYFDFWSHFVEIGEVEWDDFKEKYSDFVKQVFKILVENGITVPERLPKLLTPDELRKKIDG